MQPAALSVVFSTGRSGSTWLGSILDTHPDVVYRFEPLSRLRDDADVRALKARINAGQVDDALLAGLKRRLLRADPVTCKPPYFPKRAHPTLLRERLWPAARALRPVGALFRALYTPRCDAAVVFKEVGMNRYAIPLVRDAGLRAVYLARHPCAVVASVLEGQKAGLMPTGRRRVIAELVEEHDAALFERWRFRIPSAAPHELEALLWRIDVEEALREIGSLDHAHWVVYEELCARPAEIASQLFAHIGLPPSAQTGQLLDAMSAGTQQRARFGETWMNDYFSVFRDSREMAEKWRRELPGEVIRDVIAAVAESPAFQHCARRANWE